MPYKTKPKATPEEYNILNRQIISITEVMQICIDLNEHKGGKNVDIRRWEQHRGGSPRNTENLYNGFFATRKGLSIIADDKGKKIIEELIRALNIVKTKF